MHIWLMQTGEQLPLYPNIRKMRTAILADVLLARNHSVYWWAGAFEHQRKKWIFNTDTVFHLSDNYTIHALKGTGYKKNVSIMRYFDHLRVASKFHKLSTGLARPDVIVASTPCYHLAYESMKYARANKIPLVLDVRDLWPDTFLTSLPNKGLSILGRMVLFYDFIKISRLLRLAEGLTAMSRGCLRWGQEKVRRSSQKWDRVFYLGYKPYQCRKNPRASLNHNLKEKKIFLFVGTFGESYELNQIIDVARRFHQMQNKDILFYLAGAGEQFTRIKSAASGLPNVVLPGWIEAEKIIELLGAAWAGIVPCRSVEDAAPNKVFEYLSAGLPLISSLEGEIAELIEQYQMGINYRVGDVEGLEQSIIKLAIEPEMRHMMSQNASQFFSKHGNAHKIYSGYANYIEDLADYYYRASK